MTTLTLGDLIAMERRPYLHLEGATFYPAIVSYLLGVDRADPEVLRGFAEFVSVSYERNCVLAWHAALLRRSGLRFEDVGLESGSYGLVEAHKQAIADLFSTLRDFAEVVQAGGLDAVLAEYQQLANRD